MSETFKCRQCLRYSMGLFNNSNNGGSLTPSGIGSGPTEAQKQLFANAANESGLTAMGMNMVDQMIFKNE